MLNLKSKAQSLKLRIQKLTQELERLRLDRKKFLKTYHGIRHEDASSEAKYIQLKILDYRIANLEEAIEELRGMAGLRNLRVDQDWLIIDKV